MSIIDAFSDRNEREASRVIGKGFKRGYRTAKRELGKGFRSLKKDYAGALKKIGSTTNKAIGSITTARDSALGEFDPYVKATAGVPQMYSDALGMGGPEGHARAVGAFQAGPGYQFQMDQGMQALQRLNASRGRLDSGNTMIDAMRFAGGLADQEYDNWLNRLAGQQEFGAGIAGARAGIYTDAGKDVAGLRERMGTRQAAIKTGLGDIRYDHGGRLADLGYATKLGRAGAKADYLMGKDASGMNLVGTVLGGVRTALSGTGAGGGRQQSMGAQLLNT